MKTWLNKRKALLGKTLIVLTFLVIVFFASNVAEAGVSDTRDGCPVGQTMGVSGICNPIPQGQLDSTKNLTQNPKEPQFGCIGWGGWSLTGCIASVTYMILSVFAIFLGIAGVFLDWTINITILQFSSFVEGVNSIRLAWTVVRDALNITFIFVLLYAGIKMILGAGGTEKVLKGVILAGLLINFSFFFTSIAIDISNVLTIELHKSVKAVGDKYGGGDDDGRLGGISGAIMQGLNPQKMFKAVGEGTAAEENLNKLGASLIYQMVFGSVLILIAGIVLFALAILLVIRFVMLILLLITSPIMVMGGVLPQLDSFASKWRKELVSQLAFAPILMLFIVLTVVVVNSPEFTRSASGILGDTQNTAGVFSFVGGNVGSLLTYFVAIGMMIAGIVISKSFSGQFGGSVTSWAEKSARSIATAPGRFARYGAQAAGGLAARGVGAGARTLGGKYDLAAGRIQSAVTNARTELRNLPAGTGRGTRAAAWAARTALGGMSSVGQAADRSLRSTLKSAEGASVLGSETLADREKYERTRNTQLEQARRDAEAQKAIEEGLAATTEALKNGDYTTDENHTNPLQAAIAKKINKFIGEVGKISDKKIGEMLEEDISQFENADFAAALNSKQMKKIMESEISDEAKAKIKKARATGLGRRMNLEQQSDGTWKPGSRKKNAAGVGIIDAEEAKKIITSSSPEEVAALPIDILTTDGISQLLTPNTLAKLARDGKIDPAKLSKIRENIENHYTTPGAVISPELKKTVDWLSSQAGQVI